MKLEIPDNDYAAILFFLDHFAKAEISTLQKETNDALEKIYKEFENKTITRLLARFGLSSNGKSNMEIVLRKEILPNLLQDTYILVKRKDYDANRTKSD